MKKRSLVVLGAVIAVIVCVFGLLASIIGSSAPSSGFPLILLLLLFAAIAIIAISLASVIITAIKEHIQGVKNGTRKRLKTVFKIICFIGSIVLFLIIKLFDRWGRIEFSFSLLFALVVPGFLAMLLYFIPYLIANRKSHPQENAIFMPNLFAGWTIVAWIVALIWAYTESTLRTVTPHAAESSADEIMKFKKLLDSGAISQEEYEKKKQELLDK